MTALVEVSNRDQTRSLILQAKRGILSKDESETLESYLSSSHRLCLGTIDGKFCCAWGLIPPTLLSDRAYLWLFTTPEVESHKFLFVRRSQIEVAAMLREWPIIIGYCKASELRSVRWVRWLGGVFGNPHLGFLPFEIRANG